MLKFSFILMSFFVFSIVFATIAQAEEVDEDAAGAEKTQTAKFRSDGALIDDDGLIAGIKNPDDKRNTEYEFYYYAVDPEGNVSEDSTYKVYQNPNSTFPDFIKEDLREDEYDSVNSGAPAQQKNNTGVYEFN